MRAPGPGEGDRGWVDPPDPPDPLEALEAQLREEESLAVSRKKVLLRMLSVRECERLGIEVEPEQVRQQAVTFRGRFGLQDDAELERWLARAGLERGAFERFVREIALVEALEAHLDRAIRAELPLQRAARDLYSRTGESWVQFDAELRRDVPDGPQGSAVSVFERLWPLSDPATRPEHIRRFFAMRKPPGLRLRYAGARAGPVRELVGAALDGLVREGALRRWDVVPYEPETQRFGGAAAMALAHAWFEADSLCWMRLEPLALRGGTALDRGEVSLGVLDDLFALALPDEAEAWDAWGRLAALHGWEPPPAGTGAPPSRLGDLRERALPAEREIIQRYERANAALAGELARLARTGDMRVGPRAFLAAVALFHWNRLGLSLDARAGALATMLRALDPHRRR